MFNFSDNKATIDGLECPICNGHSCIEFLEFEYESDGYKLVKCDTCESLIYSQSPKKDAYKSSPDDDTLDDSIKHYCLMGCGIEYNISLLNQIDLSQVNSFLEIGCGFGYTLHYADKYLKLNSIGLESAKYGRIGKRILDIDIRDLYLDKSSSPIGKFDVVLASEVIEHVSDPNEFLLGVKSNLSDTGILILTTPASESIAPSTNTQECLSSLYPGEHLFLLSKKSLTDLLLKNGFLDVRVTRKNEKLVAYACLGNYLTQYIRDSSLNSDAIKYLEFLSREKNIIIREGALYRLLREYTNMGNFEDAESTLAKLISLIQENYNFEFSLFLDRFLTSGRKEKGKYIENLIPPYLGMLFYYAGILYSSKPEDIQKKLIYFQISVNLLKDYIAELPRLSQEASALLPTAELHYRISLIDNLIYQHGFASGKNVNQSYTINEPDIVRYLNHFEKLLVLDIQILKKLNNST